MRRLLKGSSGLQTDTSVAPAIQTCWAGRLALNPYLAATELTMLTSTCSFLTYQAFAAYLPLTCMAPSLAPA